MKKLEIKKLDTLWAVKIKEDVNFRCELSGLNKEQCRLNSHHFIGRRYYSLRWWLPNGVCLSVAKHKFDVWSAHENPEWFRKQMLDLRGQKWLNELRERSNQIYKGSYERVLQYLNGEIKDYL